MPSDGAIQTYLPCDIERNIRDGTTVLSQKHYMLKISCVLSASGKLPCDLHGGKLTPNLSSCIIAEAIHLSRLGWFTRNIARDEEPFVKVISL